ncbi:MAG: prepilin-type N-terminal cleavage/methylation domain-containing protein [Desulfobacterales bacterium]|nr:prepilin-type N-terminal cleavage/methylation domain-containing protein [Desulfobacterales bacterium]
MGPPLTDDTCRNKGSTLIELMISLTLIGVIMVVIFGSFRISVRAWEHGEADIAAHQRQRIILQRLAQQLSAAYTGKTDVDNDEEAYFFKADQNGLEFISDVSLIPENSYGRVYVNYRFLPDAEGRLRLMVFEKNRVFIHDGLERIRPEPEDFRVLIRDLQHIGFQFLQIDEDRRQWVEKWAINKEDGVPAAVRIEWQLEAKMTPVHVMARIVSESRDK